MFADARGVERNGQLVATNLKVGNRDDDAIRVKFSGKITAVASGRLTIDTDPGSAVVATRVDIKANKDDDGHPPPMPPKFDRKSALTPVGSISSIKGSAHLKLE